LFPTTVTTSSASARAGDVLDGRYLLLRDLGHGAAGVIFEARHLYTGRFVAVKMIHPSHGQTSTGELRARLQREARALASIQHAGVVDVLDGGVAPEGAPYVVMQMLNGRTLEGLIASRGRLPAIDTAALTLQLCDALDAVHRAGVIHRDVKPSNVIVVREPDGNERFKLVDFGIAQFDSPGDEKITKVGAVLGTPAYMPPEQMLGHDRLDARADVYSVGVTMFECITGDLPFKGGATQAIAQALDGAPPPPLPTAGLDVPPALARVVDRARAKNPAERFASAPELANAIRMALPGQTLRTALLLPGAAAPAALSPQQRRRTPRTPYNTPVRIAFGDDGVDARSEDISEGGLLVVSRVDCPANRRCTVRFALPMDGKVVSVGADIRWVRNEGRAGLRAIGLEFHDLAAPVRQSIAEYVRLMGRTE
jgi:serine/threonine-protein kinase